MVSGLSAALARWPRAARIAFTLGLATLAAGLFERLGVPLPWMLGPLLLTAGCCVLGLPLAASDRLRNGGQAVIGLALGLYFTPPVVAALLQLAPAIAAGVVWALAMGFAFARFLERAGRVDAATATFAGAIGGASEMAALAEREGGRVDRVAAAHSLRVLIVVITVPVALQLAGVRGVDPLPPAAGAVHAGGLLALVAGAAAGIALCARLGLPSPFVLGALAVSAAVTALGVEASALPKAASNAGQLVIGCALGTRFTPAFVRAAPRWLGAVAAGTVALLAACAAFALGLHALLAAVAPPGRWVPHLATLVVATVPGGIAEMAITAKVLQLGVPVVTAFQVVRYVAVLTLTAPLARWISRRRAGRGKGRAG